MQNRYAGDIGDYIKISLLQPLAAGRRLGIAWYLFPDETHNTDGRHTRYLEAPDTWRSLNPALFDALKALVARKRSVAALQARFPAHTLFAGEPLPTGRAPGDERSARRAAWFDRTAAALAAADIVFMDPDNGLVDDDPKRRRNPRFGKRIPLSEIRALCRDRIGIVYHHNSRFKGGHDAEVDHWLDRLGMPAIAVRANAYSCRTFFILNPDRHSVEQARSFCRHWQHHRVRLHVREAPDA